MTMMAFDADDPATDNAALRYNIVRQSPGSPSSNMFYIDAERGDIVTAISPVLLDREVRSSANWECVCVFLYAVSLGQVARSVEFDAGQVLFKGITPYDSYMSDMLPVSRVKKICLCEMWHSHGQGQTPDECLSISTSNWSETTG